MGPEGSRVVEEGEGGSGPRGGGGRESSSGKTSPGSLHGVGRPVYLGRRGLKPGSRALIAGEVFRVWGSRFNQGWGVAETPGSSVSEGRVSLVWVGGRKCGETLQQMWRFLFLVLENLL